jgi:hypothetical protein
MPSVTSLRTAYFTCWIGPGRCVRASLNSGLICKSPTTRSKLLKSRMPNRPMSGLQRVASERNAHQCTARRAPTQIPTPGRHRPRILPRRPCQQCQWARHRNPNRRQSRSQFRGQIQPHFRQTFAGPSRRSATGPQSIDPIHKWLRLSWTSSAVYSRAGDERERKRKKETTNFGSHSSAPGQRAAAIVYICPTHRHHGDQQEDDRAYPQLGEQRAAPRRQHAVLRALDLVERTRRPRPRRVAGGPPSAPSRSCLSTCPLLLLVVGPRVVPVDLVPAVVLAALATPHFDGNPPVEGRLSACAMPAITE